MSRWRMRAIELITGLAIVGKRYPAVIPYKAGKTKISSPEKKYFRRTTPEKHGISSKRIYDMLSELEAERGANIHNLMVIKDGEVIAECSHPGYDVNTFHLSHSMSKTVTGMAIGFLCDEGLITTDTKLVNIFPEYTPADKKFRDITVKHLLNMSTGINFSEAGSVTESEWTEAFFSAKVDFAPGSMFAYNSMNSYILGKIVTRISGMSLMEFLKERLFDPLKIENVFWEIGPEGIEKGGWGLYLSLESWAKLGVMMLNGGRFENNQILPQEWVKESTEKQNTVPESAGAFNYGYQIWVGRNGKEFLFNGMLGQNVWVYPDKNLVVVINSENNELFQKSPSLAVIEKYLGSNSDIADTNTDYSFSWFAKLKDKERRFFESRHWIRPKTALKGLTYKLGLRNKTPYDKAWDKILGTYKFARNNHGILPFFVRAMQNNYMGGIDSFKFEREKERLYFTSKEGGIEYRFEVGLYDFKYTVLNFNGEKYIVAAMGEATENEDRIPVYKLEILFPEMPNSRKIKFSFGTEGQLIVKMKEVPDENLAAPLVDAIYTTNPKLAFAVTMLEKRLGDKFINKKLESLFSPILIGANTDSPNYYTIIDAERLKADEASKATSAIASLLLKFTGESKVEKSD